MRTVTRRNVLTLAGAAAAADAASVAAKQRPRPHLLFLVADSWRGVALPSSGDPNLRAPNLELLAKQGVHCRRAYTSYPVCCPSRAAMLTGRMPHAAGVRANHTLLPLDQPTMSAAMKAAGYRTGFIGKWHLDGRANPGFVPPERRRGSDDWTAFNVAHQQFDTLFFRDDPASPLRTRGFEPDVETDMAIEFLRKGSEADRRRQPFYLYVSYVAPHAPLTPPARHASTYNPASLQLRPNVPAEFAARARKDLAGYYGLCSAVDENVGRLLKELDATGAAENTIVVFTADHGQSLWSRGRDEIDAPWEETARIPLLMRYPGRIRAGSRTNELISNIDFAPTLLSLCGVPALEGAQGRLKGVLGKVPGGGGNLRQSVYAEGALGQTAEWRMVVKGRHKLVVNSRLEATHLFDLERDPYELTNLVGERRLASTIRDLQAVRRQWASHTGG